MPKSPPPSYASVASGSTEQEKEQAAQAKIAVIEAILEEEDLYKLLGVKRNAKPDEIRRGFLNRSRSCHPDKFPNYPAATSAFQKVAFAHETLSKPTSRRMYDVSGRTDFAAAMNNGGPDGSGSADGSHLGEDTLNGVLYSVFCEFMEGDFEMIRVLVNALNEGNPSMNLGDDAVDSIEGAFKRLRDIMLAGKRYLSIIRDELIRLYEIQHSLRQLSYFNITGRLKLTLQLARVTINIPLAIDQAMKQQAAAEGTEADGTDVCESSSEDEQDDDEAAAQSAQHNKSKEHRNTSSQTASDDFGVASEDDDDDEDNDPDNERSEARAEEMARARRKAARARRRAAQRQERAKLHGDGDPEDEASQNSKQAQRALQKRGLLPSSAVNLLKGVAFVLETSEAWVPGSVGVSKSDDA